MTTAADTITIPTRIVPYGPKGVEPRLATADYLADVLRKVQAMEVEEDGDRPRRRIHVGGSNVTATMERLLLDVVAALRSEPTATGTALDGATDVGEPGTWPLNAGEFASRWNRHAPEERDQHKRGLVQAQIIAERARMTGVHARYDDLIAVASRETEPERQS